MATELATAYIALVPTTRGIQGQLTRDLTAQAGPAGDAAGRVAGQRAGKSFSTSFGSAVKGLAKTGAIVSGIALGIGGAIATLGVKSAASLEQTQVAFTSLLGSSKLAQAQIQDLQKFAARTPFSQQDVFGYAQQYFALADSVGLAKDQVKPFLTAIGNIGAVTGASTQNIHNAVLAIGQIGSAGKVTQDNLRQISEAFPGFNANAAIAAATGQTTADVMKQIQAGTLDAATGVQALLKGMKQFNGASGAMQKQSRTLNGLFSTFADTVKIKLTQSFQTLIPVVKNELTQLTPAIAQTLGKLAPQIAQFAKGFAPFLIPLMQGLGTAIGAVFQALGPALKAITPIIVPLANTFAQLVQAAAPFITLLAQIVAQVGPPLLHLFSALAQAVTPLIRALSAALLPILPVLVRALNQIANAIVPVVTALANALAPVLPIIAKAITRVVVALAPLIKAFAGAFVQFLNSIGPLLPQVASALADMAVAFARLLRALMPLIKPLFAILGAFTKGIALSIIAVAKAITFLVDAITAGVTQIRSAFGILSSFVTGATGQLIQNAALTGSAFDNLHPHLQLVASMDVSGLIAGVNAAVAASITGFNRIQSAAQAVAGGIIAGVKAITGGQIPIPAPLTGGGISTGGGGGGGTGGGAGSVKPKPPAPPKFDHSLIGQFVKSIKGSVVDVRQAIKALIQSGKQSKQFSDQFINGLTRENSHLTNLVERRNKIGRELAKANAALSNLTKKRNQEISTVRSATTGTFDITSAGTGFDGQQPITFQRILAQVKQAVSRATQFTAILKRLAKEGLAETLIRQLAEAGPGALDQAKALLSATPKQLRNLNSQFKQLGQQGTKLGKFVGNDLYQAGIASARGLVRGLQSQENALTKAVKKLAEAMVRQIKKTLKIHSPSLVTRDLGGLTGAGFALGLADQHEAVRKQADRLANSAIPSRQMAEWRRTSPRDAAQPIVVHNYTVLDSKIVAHSVNEHNGRQLAALG